MRAALSRLAGGHGSKLQQQLGQSWSRALLAAFEHGQILAEITGPCATESCSYRNTVFGNFEIHERASSADDTFEIVAPE